MLVIFALAVLFAPLPSESGSIFKSLKINHTNPATAEPFTSPVTEVLNATSPEPLGGNSIGSGDGENEANATFPKTMGGSDEHENATLHDDATAIIIDIFIRNTSASSTSFPRTGSATTTQPISNPVMEILNVTTPETLEASGNGSGAGNENATLQPQPHPDLVRMPENSTKNDTESRPHPDPVQIPDRVKNDTEPSNQRILVRNITVPTNAASPDPVPVAVPDAARIIIDIFIRKNYSDDARNISLPTNNVTSEGEAGPIPLATEDIEACPYACPPGWTRFGFSENCYLLPAQPAKLDTFWNHQARCKEAEPTSYIMVIDSIAEQAVATPIAWQYAANWFAVLTNGFFWLGGYTTDNGWQFLDGTDQSDSVLMIGANLIGSTKNSTCLGADPKTLGLWQTRPCDDMTGAAICEMPKRRVCGKTGGMLPISPISLQPSEWANLFPKMPSIPYIGQIFSESRLGSAVSSIGSAFSNFLGVGSTSNEPESKCPLACPPGWLSAGPAGENCYLLPKMPAQLDTFWNLQAWCKQRDPTAYIAIPNGIMEEAIATSITRYYGREWLAVGTDGHLWMGAYATGKGWRFLDGSDQSGNILMTLANLVGATKNGTCLSADFKTAGLWEARPCSDTSGTAFCEMPKKRICSNETGDVFPFPVLELTPEYLKQLFPKMPSVPFLEQILGNGGSDDFFNPLDADKNNKTHQKYGDSTAYVICAKQSTGFFATSTSKPDWTWLYADGKQVEIPGKWTQFKCTYGYVDSFRVQPATYVGAWSRCRNLGYEVAMPANSLLSGWYPFQVGKDMTEYYREDTGLFSKLTASYVKMEGEEINKC